MSFNLGAILRRGLEITLRYRVLWLYGFLVALLGGDCFRLGGNLNFGERQGEDLQGFFQGLDPAMLVTLVVVLLFLIALFWVLSLVIGNWALGALLGGIHQVATEGATTFGQSASLGWRYFWPLLAVGLLSGLVMIVLLLPVVAVGIITAISQQFAFLLTLCLWLPVALVAILVLMLVVVVAQVHVVLKDAGPLAALGSAWRLFTRHLWELLLVWLVNDVAIGCAAGCAVSAIVAIAAIPALIGFLVNPAVGVVLLLPTLVVLLLGVLVSGVVQVFRRAVWLLVCQELGRETLSP